MLRVVGLHQHLLPPRRPPRDALGSLPLPQLSSSAIECGGVLSPSAEFSCGRRAWARPLLAEAPGPASPCSALTSLMIPWFGWLLALTSVFLCCSALLRKSLSQLFSRRKAPRLRLCSLEARMCLG